MSILYLLITVNKNLSCSVWGDIAVDEHHYISLGRNDDTCSAYYSKVEK